MEILHVETRLLVGLRLQPPPFGTNFLLAVNMTPYSTKSGKQSGVEAYKIGEDFISIKFREKSFLYKYSYESAGKMVIEDMKSLATAQQGLSTYISQHDPPYEKIIYLTSDPGL